MFKVFDKNGEGGGSAEALEFDVDLGEDAPAPKEGEAGYVAPEKVDQPVTKKYDFTSLKEYDPDINEDNFIEKVTPKLKGYKELEARAKDLEIVAKGNKITSTDPEINKWEVFAKKSNEDLYLLSESYQYMQDGMEAAAAQEKAAAKLERLKKENPDAIEERGRSERAGWKRNIEGRTTELLAEQTKAEKRLAESQQATDPKKRSASVLESIDKSDRFFDIKFPSDEKLKESIKGEAKTYIESGKFEKDLNDPDFLAQIAIFGANRKKVLRSLATKSVAQKQSGGAFNAGIRNTPYIPPKSGKTPFDK
jgi:hypothetical protein